MKFIPYGQHSISHEDIDEISKVLMSEWLTQGPMISKFEEAILAYCNAKYATAVSSATAALHLACLALDLKSGDYLWTSPNTFVASANCALYCGANVDFVDINLKTFNMCTDALEEKLITAEKLGKLPKVVIPVHFAGQSCNMEKIKSLSKRYGFKVIEDASHAIGGLYKDSKIGSCEYSDITVFSFHPVKIITTGEGGMLLTNNKKLHETLRRLRTHGITRDEEYMESKSHGPWYYQQIELGFNYRITDIQAALGLSQLKRLDQQVLLRNKLSANYAQEFVNLPIVIPFVESDCYSAWHLYSIMLEIDKLKKTRLQVFEEMRKANIGVNVHYIPVNKHPYYQQHGFKDKKYPNAEFYYERTMTLPLYPAMLPIDQERVIFTLKKVLR
ncbi:MAG: hypothetical protein ACD_46C00181G0015 [uncultured bacterium]|nr:MAG: hypothetical protein ACD_46C00181G0015 [uncultured bacterium]